MKDNPNLLGGEDHHKEENGSYPQIFSLKTVYETGLNITFDIFHLMFPLSNYFYTTNKINEIKLHGFVKKNA